MTNGTGILGTPCAVGADCFSGNCIRDRCRELHYICMDGWHGYCTDFRLQYSPIESGAPSILSLFMLLLLVFPSTQ